MEFMGVKVEPDTTWMKFADLMVDSGVISDYIENNTLHTIEKEAAGRASPEYRGPDEGHRILGPAGIVGQVPALP